MKTSHRSLLIFTLLFFIDFSIFAQHSWDDNEYTYTQNMDKLIYSSRYFGPNALPIPTLRNGLTYDRFEAEMRWEYHHYTGDKTNNLFARAAIPFVRGIAALEITLVFAEKFVLTPETQKERHAAHYRNYTRYTGDVVLSGIFQLLRKKEWIDIMLNLSLKTASGDQVEHARFTDAAAYWFDLNFGKDVYRNEPTNTSFRLQALGGFYCWMTNSVTLRQNDAYVFGAGFTATHRNFTFSSEFAGFSGYKHNGDRPQIIRNNLQFDYKKNILSLRYNHGIRDNLYKTFSIAYIRYY